MNPLDELKEQMNTPEFKESAKKFIEEYYRKIEKNKNKVSSKEYIDWVYKYVSTNKHADDESALYTYKDIDAENGKILSCFFDYVKDLAMVQRILVIPDDKCVFANEQVAVKINDKYFKLRRMYGQGVWTSIELLDEEPDYMFVKIS